ncbi:MAG: NYN domain-containing protein [Candidatus Dormibacteraeota bacterium]|nr:NYN domain-containing protein [Candidatus Dormibacteraeota bacterium]
MGMIIVDGYNVIHAWPALKRTLERRGLEDARRQLVTMLADYAAQTPTSVTVVFDAHGREPAGEPAEVIDGVTVVFGTRTASADHVIERLAGDAARRGEAGGVTVATGDRLQRALVGAMGIGTISASALEIEVSRVRADMANSSTRRQREAGSARRVESHLDAETRRRLEEIRRGGQTL